ncbi:MAG: tetratricopeptide repeat protein, partial [Euryarchaeota archaeon]|nr:tetratricopeptide repeat protein [Euryarchaeota archaeon]
MNGEEAFERGLEFYEREEYSKAIECYEKALDDENFDAPGDVWNKMGVAYTHLKKYEKAVECYEKA